MDYEFGTKGWIKDESEENKYAEVRLIAVDNVSDTRHKQYLVTSHPDWDNEKYFWVDFFSTEKPKIYKELDQSVFDGEEDSIKIAIICSNGDLHFGSYNNVRKYNNGNNWEGLDEKGYWGKCIESTDYKPMTKLERIFPEIKPEMEGFYFCNIKEKNVDYTDIYNSTNFSGFWYSEEPKTLHSSHVMFYSKQNDSLCVAMDSPKAECIRRPKYIAFKK